MTPKEKAEDLLYQMRYDHMSGILTKKKAKRCAKIAVGEILSVVWYVPVDIEYWEEVEQELQKL